MNTRFHRANTLLTLARNLRDREARKRQAGFKDKARATLIVEKHRIRSMKVAKASDTFIEAERLFRKGRFEEAFLAASQIEGIINDRHADVLSAIRILPFSSTSWTRYSEGDYDGAFKAMRLEMSEPVKSRLDHARSKLGDKKIARAHSLLERAQHFVDIGEYECAIPILEEAYTTISNFKRVADYRLPYLRKELEKNGLPGDLLLDKATKLLADGDYDGFFEENTRVLEFVNTKIKYFLVPSEELTQEEREDYLRLVASFSRERTIKLLGYQQIMDSTFATMSSPEMVAKIEETAKKVLPPEDKMEQCKEISHGSGFGLEDSNLDKYIAKMGLSWE